MSWNVIVEYVLAYTVQSFSVSISIEFEIATVAYEKVAQSEMMSDAMDSAVILAKQHPTLVSDIG